MRQVFELSIHMKAVSRADGESATAKAAYRACCVIECDREGRIHDYTRKTGLEICGIALPRSVSAPRWARDRAKAWNEAEGRETNKDKRAKTKEKANARPARAALLLIKPRCFLDEVGNRLLGQGQPGRTETIAEEFEAALHPANKCLVRVFLQTERRKPLIDRLHRTAKPKAGLCIFRTGQRWLRGQSFSGSFVRLFVCSSLKKRGTNERDMDAALFVCSSFLFAMFYKQFQHVALVPFVGVRVTRSRYGMLKLFVGL
jgi:MobA/MobL family